MVGVQHPLGFLSLPGISGWVWREGVTTFSPPPPSLPGDAVEAAPQNKSLEDSGSDEDPLADPAGQEPPSSECCGHWQWLTPAEPRGAT